MRIKKKKKGTSNKVEATFKYLETVKTRLSSKTNSKPPPNFDESSNFFFPPLREITKNTKHRRVKPTVSHTLMNRARPSAMANERTQYPLIGSSFHPWPGQVESRLFGFFAPAKKFASPDYTRALSPSLPPLSFLGLHTRHRRRGLMLRRRNGFKNAAGRILALAMAMAVAVAEFGSPTRGGFCSRPRARRQ